MKENKKIDNKMKAKKLAAYTLATCMTVTVAPIGAVTPIMAQEVESVEMLGALTTAKNMTVSIETKITAGMTYKDAVNKIIMNDLTKDASVGTLVSNHITISDEAGELYNDQSDTSKANDKFEVGKKYTITAKFNTNGLTLDTTSVKVDENKAIVNPRSLDMSAYELDLTTSSSALKLDEYPDYNGKYAYRNEKGEIQKVTTIVQQGADWLYVKDGYRVTSLTSPILASNAYGTWLVGTDGKVNFTAEGLAKDADGNVVYVKSGKIDSTATFAIDVADSADLTGNVAAGVYNIVNGKLKKGVTVAHVKDSADWVYIDKNGKGAILGGAGRFATNENGTWALKTSGSVDVVDFAKTGLVLDANGDVDSTVKTYYVNNGKIDFTKNDTVVADENDAYPGAKVIKNGVVQTSANLPGDTVLQGTGTYDGSWFAVDKKGDLIKAQASNSVFVSNKYGTWVIDEDGEVNFTAKGLLVDSRATVSVDASKIYYVEGGKIKTDKTGFVTAAGEFEGAVGAGKYYVENGVVATPGAKDNAVVYDKDDDKWYLLDANGNIDTTDSVAIAKNKYGTWAIALDGSGEVKFDFTGIKRDADNVIGTDPSKKYYFEKSKLDLTKTGIVVKDSANPSSSTNLVYVEKGVVTGRNVEDSVVQKDADWYSIDSNGDIDTSSNLGKNKYGIWKLDAGNTGKVLFNYENIYPVSSNDVKVTGFKAGTQLYFKGGKFQSNFTGLVKSGTSFVYVENGVVGNSSKTDILQASDGNWYYVEDGTINPLAEGIFENANGKWWVKDGKVDFNKTGIVTLTSGDKYYVEKGKMSGTITGFVNNGSTKVYVVNNKVTPAPTTDNVIQDKSTGKWYCVDTDGTVKKNAQFGINDNGIWFIGDDGAVDFTKSGVVVASVTVGSITAGDVVTVSKGKYVPAETVTGIYNVNSSEILYVNGVASSDTGIYAGKYINGGYVSAPSGDKIISDSITNVGKKVYIKDGIFQNTNKVVTDGSTYVVESGIVVDTAETEYLAADGLYYDITVTTGVATPTDGVKSAAGGKYKIYSAGTLITNQTGYTPGDDHAYDIDGNGIATQVS